MIRPGTGDVIDWEEPGLMARFTQLIEDGHTNIKLARIMTAEYGYQFTKNAVIGKRRRLAKPPRPAKPPREFDPASPPREPRKRKPKLGEPVCFLDLRWYHCRYPNGTWPEITFCGHPIVQGSYCQLHHDLTHHALRPRVV
jgi:hypothetical protein